MPGQVPVQLLEQTHLNYPYLSGAKQIPFCELAQARIAGDQVIDVKVPDPTGGATHYYATAMKKAPVWAAKAKQTVIRRARLLQGRAMSPAAGKLVGVLLVLLSIAGGTWQVQDWRYGKQLAEQAGLHQNDLTAIGNAAADQVRADQDKRLALEQRLSARDRTHHKELTNAQTDQARLRDRLATADVRLSSPHRCCGSSRWLCSASRYRRRRRGSCSP